MPGHLGPDQPDRDPGRRRGEPAGHHAGGGLRLARHKRRAAARRRGRAPCSSGPTTSTAATTTTCRRPRRSRPTPSSRDWDRRTHRAATTSTGRGCRRWSCRPYSRPHAVTNVVHDHTSILATIEAKWNLPACTMRDANAATLADFLDIRATRRSRSRPRSPAPHDIAASEQNCSDADPQLTVHPNPPAKKPKHRKHKPKQAQAQAASSSPQGRPFHRLEPTCRESRDPTEEPPPVADHSGQWNCRSATLSTALP